MKINKILILSAAVAMVLASGSAFAGGDAVKGKKAFKRCKVCHSIEAGKQKMGPSLAGIVGKKAGTVEGFTKYKGLEGSDIVWTEAALDEFFTNPRAMVPKSKMPTKVKKAQDRADIIAYLKAN